MTAHDVAKVVMKLTKTSQADIAKKNGLAGQSSVSMYFQSKSMRVDSLLMILNACGYELVARSADGTYPEFVIGDEAASQTEDDRIAEMVRKAVAVELAKRELEKPRKKR